MTSLSPIILLYFFLGWLSFWEYFLNKLKNGQNNYSFTQRSAKAENNAKPRSQAITTKYRLDILLPGSPHPLKVPTVLPSGEHKFRISLWGFFRMPCELLPLLTHTLISSTHIFQMIFPCAFIMKTWEKYVVDGSKWGAGNNIIRLNC